MELDPFPVDFLFCFLHTWAALWIWASNNAAACWTQTISWVKFGGEMDPKLPAAFKQPLTKSQLPALQMTSLQMFSNLNCDSLPNCPVLSSSKSLGYSVLWTVVNIISKCCFLYFHSSSHQWGKDWYLEESTTSLRVPPGSASAKLTGH